MKSLDPAFAAHLAGGVTTLAHAWIVIRRDGVTLGFTDHDRDLTVNGVTCRAVSGFTASAVEDQLGLAVSNLDVAGALSNAALTEVDIAAGRYDGAAISILKVNWTDPKQFTELRRGSIGRITRGLSAFTAELRGLAAALDQPAGRVYGRDCAWTLGDARCRVGVTAVTGTIGAVRSRFALSVVGEGTQAKAVIQGLLAFTGGAGAGLVGAVLAAAADGTDLVVELALPLPAGVSAGDGVRIAPGCDRTLATCRDRFANVANFGGFPHMPGNDFVLASARQGEGNDGSKLT